MTEIMNEQTQKRMDKLLWQLHHDGKPGGEFRFTDNADREAARRELAYYRNGRGQYADWVKYEQGRKAIAAAAEKKAAEEAADRAKTEAEAAAAAAADIQAELERRVAAETDPIVQYRRQRAARTF